MTPIGYTTMFVDRKYVEVLTHGSIEAAEAYRDGFAAGVALHGGDRDSCYALPGEDETEMRANEHPQQVSLALAALKRARIERGDDGQ